MTRVYFILTVSLLVLLDHYFVVINAQGLQQLSYANADIGEKLIRSTIPTTPIPTTTTTQRTGFFSGIRNIFSKKAPTTITSSTVSPTATTTEAGLLKSNSDTPILSPSRSPINVIVQTTTWSTTKPTTPTNLIVQTTASTTKATTTTAPSSYQTHTTKKVPAIRDEFPALPSPKQRPSGVITTTTQASQAVQTQRTNQPSLPSHNAWSTHPTENPVSGKQPAYQNVPTLATPSVDVSDNELETLFENLFKKEGSTLFSQISINYQGRTYSSGQTDEAPQPLLTVNDTQIDAYSSIAKMRLLYNNYEIDSMVNEYVTPMERNEENDFVDSLMATPLMRQAMLFLKEKGKVTADPKTHRELLKTIWFRLYSRGHGKIGSSGFEHIFLTELKNDQISGLHNWIYLHEEEKAGRLDYKGYIKKTELGNKGVILKYRFSYNGVSKPVNTMFIGTSPELEVALYTICFEIRPDASCPVSLGGTKFNIRTYTFRYRGKNLIGSAFPEI